METLDLKLDEQNELEFELEIEASGQVSPPSARLMCESKGLSFVFDGEISGDGGIKVVIPALKGLMTEGKHTAKLEVFLDNKYFVPLEFNANFKESVKVMAEIKSRTSKPVEMVRAVIKSKPAISKPAISEDTKKEERARAKKALQEQVSKKRLAKEQAEKKRLLEEKKRRLLEVKRRKLEEAKRRKLLEEKKRHKNPDAELRDLLSDLGISED